MLRTQPSLGLSNRFKLILPQVWALGKSTVGSGAEAKVYARNTPVSICGLKITPVSRYPSAYWAFPKSAHIDLQGDIVFCDALEGVVAIPKDLVDDVIDLMPKLVHADERVKEDVQAGSSVFEAFKKHRS